MLDYFGKLNRNVIDHIQYRGTMVTGEITRNNGDGTYAVKIAQADESYPYVETAFPNMIFGVGEIVLVTFEYGSKEMPRILGYAKRIAQHPVDVEVDESGEGGDPITTVETLDAYLITGVTAHLEGKISLSEGTGNCTRRGFQYGLTTDYGLDTHTDGSYGSGSYALRITDLNYITVYHFRAYAKDVNNNIVYGEDNTFITMRGIDIGSPKIYLNSYHSSGYTFIAKENPANDTGKITCIELLAIHSDMTGVIVATFNEISADTLTVRDRVHLANIPYIPINKSVVRMVDRSGNPISLDVVQGDYIGMYWSGGNVSFEELGVGTWYSGGDQTLCIGKGFPFMPGRTMSLYGTG